MKPLQRVLVEDDNIEEKWSEEKVRGGGRCPTHWITDLDFVLPKQIQRRTAT